MAQPDPAHAHGTDVDPDDCQFLSSTEAVMGLVSQVVSQDRFLNLFVHPVGV